MRLRNAVYVPLTSPCPPHPLRAGFDAPLPAHASCQQYTRPTAVRHSLTPVPAALAPSPCRKTRIYGASLPTVYASQDSRPCMRRVMPRNHLSSCLDILHISPSAFCLKTHSVSMPRYPGIAILASGAFASQHLFHCPRLPTFRQHLRPATAHSRSQHCKLRLQGPSSTISTVASSITSGRHGKSFWTGEHTKKNQNASNSSSDTSTAWQELQGEDPLCLRKEGKRWDEEVREKTLKPQAEDHA